MNEKTLINVNRLLDGDRKICLKLTLDPQYSIKGYVDVDVTLSRRSENIIIKGLVKFTHKLQCSRCSKEILRKRTEKIDVHYVPSKLLSPELELTEKDVNTLFYEGDLINLEQLVRDAIILSMPMKPLCKPDCKGLCPRCGRDLNEGECGCTGRSIDPRWQTLEKLLH